MTKKKTSYLPKFEVLVILVFFLSFIFWAVPKCTSTKAAYQEQEAEERLIEMYLDSLKKAEEQAIVDKEKKEEAPAEEPALLSNDKERYTPLYITIDGMNIRSGPTLKSKVLDRLNLYDEVAFMDEVTNSKDTIELGGVTAVEPWVKVRTRKGKVGWVYGAGVSYYKTKLEGIE